MSYLSRMLAAAQQTNYTTTNYAGLSEMVVGSSSGAPVSAESALKLSTAWACDRLISETVASLPAMIFERMADGGRKRATNHPLYDVLHRQPNEYQTPIEFFDFMSHCAIMRGNGMARIVAGPRGFVDQLIPLHPDYVQIEVLSNRALRYRVNEPGKEPMTLLDEDVLHLNGMSKDGRTGMSVISYARDSLGLALSADQYGARFFRNNAEPRGVLKSPKPLSPQAATRVKDSWEAAHRGENQHRVAVLEEGLDYQAVSVNNKDSQFLETRAFQAEDVCRWFRVPPHMVGLTSKVTSWGSGIEQLGQGFITYTLMPWLVRWQQAIGRDLILAPAKYFAEFVVDALLRGDIKTRYDAFAIGRQWGWLSANDIRRAENMNPIENGDDYLLPAGYMPAGQQVIEGTARPSGAVDHYDLLLKSTAGRIARKEEAALSKALKRGDWRVVAEEFFKDHADQVAENMGVALSTAQTYVSEQKSRFLTDGAEALNDWVARTTARLVQLTEA